MSAKKLKAACRAPLSDFVLYVTASENPSYVAFD